MSIPPSVLEAAFATVRSQTGDNFSSHFEEGSPIPDYFDSQTYTNILQESSILCSCRKCSLQRELYEHYRSRHHNNQVPTDQFVMNRPDVVPTLRHVSVQHFIDPITNGSNILRYYANSRALVPTAESSTTNNSRTDYARSRVPRLHQSSSHSRREVVEQEHRQSSRDYPRVIRPIPNRLYDPIYAMYGLPVDPILRAFKQIPNFPILSATSDESSSTNNSRTEYAHSTVPRLHQSSSHSGREVVEQEHRQSSRDYPRVIRPIPNSLYDPSYAAIGLPVDPILRAFKRSPNFSMPSATSDEKE